MHCGPVARQKPGIEINVRELVPNLLPYLVAVLVLAVSASILAAVGLQAMGLGPQNEPTPGVRVYWMMYYSAFLRDPPGCGCPYDYPLSVRGFRSPEPPWAGFRQFLLLGRRKVGLEWALICMAHNLNKLHGGRSGQPTRPPPAFCGVFGVFVPVRAAIPPRSCGSRPGGMANLASWMSTTGLGGTQRPRQTPYSGRLLDRLQQTERTDGVGGLCVPG